MQDSMHDDAMREQHEYNRDEYSRSEGSGQTSGDDLQEALSGALGDDPRADDLRAMRHALVERRQRLMHDLDTAESDAERDKLRRALHILDEQIAVLGEEAEITSFVEDAVRVGLEMRRLNESY